MSRKAELHDASELEHGAHDDAPEARSERRVLVSIPIDEIADAALSSQRDAKTELRCDACDAPIEGEAGGAGLYMWTRGDEVRFEEPALCESCATAIGVTALGQWMIEEEEG